jgi:hypothetical protein
LVGGRHTAIGADRPCDRCARSGSCFRTTSGYRLGYRSRRRDRETTPRVVDGEMARKDGPDPPRPVNDCATPWKWGRVRHSGPRPRSQASEVERREDGDLKRDRKRRPAHPLESAQRNGTLSSAQAARTAQPLSRPAPHRPLSWLRRSRGSRREAACMRP